MFKARVLNDFVMRHQVHSVVEFGCGDGNQLALASYPAYLGLDISRQAIEMCMGRFGSDRSKSFVLYDPSAWKNHGAIAAELALSLDVILHLADDEQFQTHMRHLFGAAIRHVGIFAPNVDVAVVAPHVRYRHFTKWIECNAPEWVLLECHENPNKGDDSSADLFFFERVMEADNARWTSSELGR